MPKNTQVIKSVFAPRRPPSVSSPSTRRWRQINNKDTKRKKENESDTTIHMKYKTRAFLYCLCFHVKTGISSLCLFFPPNVSFLLSSHRAVGSCQKGGECASEGNGSTACRGLCASQQVRGPLKLIIGLSQLQFLREEMEKKRRSRLEGGEDPAFGVHPALTGLPTAGNPQIRKSDDVPAVSWFRTTRYICLIFPLSFYINNLSW